MPIATLVEHVVDTLAPDGSDDDIAVLALRWTARRVTPAEPVLVDQAEAVAPAG
jgi:hypothetical protein